jgi:riboflavin synthase
MDKIAVRRQERLAMSYNIIAMTLKGRSDNAVKVQHVLTENGCQIKARIGLHDGTGDACSNEGLIILQVCGSDKDIKSLMDGLNAIDGVNAKHITLD